MKKTCFNIGCTAFAAVLLLALAACQLGGKEIPVKVTAWDNEGDPSASFSVNRNVAGLLETGGALLAVEPGFDSYTEFYGKLGTKKESITPTKFVLWAHELDAFANDETGMDIIDGGEGVDLDFTKPQTFDVGNIPTGVTCLGIAFGFQLRDIEFDWPDDWAHASSFYKESPVSDGTIDLGLKSYQVRTDHISRNADQFGLQDILDGKIYGGVSNIFFGGDTRKLYFNAALPANDIIPAAADNIVGLNRNTMDQVENANNCFESVVVAPFEPITIPESASSVTFSMSWDLTGLIERYEGATENDDDDVLVLKNGWWNGLYINASVQ